jgi:hypothetical protein
VVLFICYCTVSGRTRRRTARARLVFFAFIFALIIEYKWDKFALEEGLLCYLPSMSRSTKGIFLSVFPVKIYEFRIPHDRPIHNPFLLKLVHTVNRIWKKKPTYMNFAFPMIGPSHSLI